jgi:cell division protein FtsB
MLKRKSIDASRRMTVADLDAASVEERTALSRSNDKLSEENAELRDEVEELTAMVEILRGQKSGQKGVVSPRRSPLVSPVDGPRPW